MSRKSSKLAFIGTVALFMAAVVLPAFGQPVTKSLVLSRPVTIAEASAGGLFGQIHRRPGRPDRDQQGITRNRQGSLQAGEAEPACVRQRGHLFSRQ